MQKKKMKFPKSFEEPETNEGRIACAPVGIALHLKQAGTGPSRRHIYILYLRGKPFWFSSLCQREQFGGFLKVCRTFGVEYIY